MGPPVFEAMAAISLSVIGGNFPAFGPAGRAAPSSHSTASSSMPQIIAARRHISFFAASAALIVASPTANVTREPSVTSFCPNDPVSAMIVIDARDPPISGLPSDTVTVPSGVMLSDTQVSPPKLNQNPQATPRP